MIRLSRDGNRTVLKEGDAFLRLKQSTTENIFAVNSVYHNQLCMTFMFCERFLFRWVFFCLYLTSPFSLYCLLSPLRSV